MLQVASPTKAFFASRFFLLPTKESIPNSFLKIPSSKGSFFINSKSFFENEVVLVNKSYF